MRAEFAIAAVVFFLLLAAGTNSLEAASVIQVAPDGDFQDALNHASAGDTIILQAGATFVGNFVLPKKDGSDFITITSSASNALPLDVRVRPSDSGNMTAVVTPNGASALSTAAGAHHYRIVGLEIRPADGVYGSDLVAFGDGTSSDPADLAHDLQIDRVYIHGDPLQGSKRGIALNSASTTITNSYISDIKSTWQDSQAICGWNGPGPYTIANNYLEASGENLMFGGAAPSIANLVPSDITILHNYFYKPLSWRQSDTSYAGTLWSVKNLFELKNARRVTVEGNIFENNWGQSQTGFALQLTVRAEFGAAAWAVVDSVTFLDNIVRHAGSGVNILGQDDNSNNQGQTQNVTFRNNVFQDIDGGKWTGAGYLFQFLNGARNFTIDHNTALQSGSLIVADQSPSPGLVFQNNIAALGEYGVFGSGQGSGVAALNAYFPAWTFSNNVVLGYRGYPPYPAGNSYPASIVDIDFADANGGDFRLTSASPFRGQGTDGADPGADIDAITSATQYVISGTPPYQPVRVRTPHTAPAIVP